MVYGWSLSFCTAPRPTAQYMYKSEPGCRMKEGKPIGMQFVDILNGDCYVWVKSQRSFGRMVAIYGTYLDILGVPRGT